NKAVIQRLKLDVDELRERVKALEQQLSETTKESSNSQADQPPPLIRLGSPNMEPEPSVMYEMLGDRERQLSALAVNGNKSLTETDPVWVGRIITVDHILDMTSFSGGPYDPPFFVIGEVLCSGMILDLQALRTAEETLASHRVLSTQFGLYNVCPTITVLE